eukprot:scaffold22430_cov20-Cyclotella_meneghiniana.AAC.1
MELLESLTCDDIDGLIKDETITGGMIPKVTFATDAVKLGVKGAFITDGRVPHALLNEVLAGGEKGMGSGGGGTILSPALSFSTAWQQQILSSSYFLALRLPALAFLAFPCFHASNCDIQDAETVDNGCSKNNNFDLNLLIRSVKVVVMFSLKLTNCV